MTFKKLDQPWHWPNLSTLVLRTAGSVGGNTMTIDSDKSGYVIQFPRGGSLSKIIMHTGASTSMNATSAIELRIETMDSASENPSGNLYDSPYSSAIVSPVTSEDWHVFDFATNPTITRGDIAWVGYAFDSFNSGDVFSPEGQNILRQKTRFPQSRVRQNQVWGGGVADNQAGMPGLIFEFDSGGTPTYYPEYAHLGGVRSYPVSVSIGNDQSVRFKCPYTCVIDGIWFSNRSASDYWFYLIDGDYPYSHGPDRTKYDSVALGRVFYDHASYNEGQYLPGLLIFDSVPGSNLSHLNRNHKIILEKDKWYRFIKCNEGNQESGNGVTSNLGWTFYDSASMMQALGTTDRVQGGNNSGSGWNSIITKLGSGRPNVLNFSLNIVEIDVAASFPNKYSQRTIRGR